MLTNSVPAISPEELSHILDGLDMLEDWAKAVRAAAHTLAENGTQIPGYQLVEKIGNRKWAIPMLFFRFLVFMLHLFPYLIFKS